MMQIVAVGFPTLIFLMLFYGILLMFIPVMGRLGSEVVPDLVVAVICCIGVILCMGYQVGLVYVTDSATLKRIILVLAGICGVSLTLVAATSLGFPYRYDAQSPSRQRHVFHHVYRKYHDITGQVVKSDAGILDIPFDYFGVDAIRPHIPEMKELKPLPCQGTYCGLPFYFPLIYLIRKVYYIPTAPPVLEPGLTMVVKKREQTGPNTERITLEFEGPNHINLFLEPKPGVTLTKWSVGSGIPHPTQTPDEVGETFYVFYSYGQKPKKPWEFWVEMEIADSVRREEGVLDLAANTHYTYGPSKRSPELQDLLDRLPDWVVPMAWNAGLELFVL